MLTTKSVIQSLKKDSTLFRHFRIVASPTSFKGEKIKARSSSTSWLEKRRGKEKKRSRKLKGLDTRILHEEWGVCNEELGELDTCEARSQQRRFLAQPKGNVGHVGRRAGEKRLRSLSLSLSFLYASACIVERRPRPRGGVDSLFCRKRSLEESSRFFRALFFFLLLFSCCYSTHTHIDIDKVWAPQTTIILQLSPYLIFDFLYFCPFSFLTCYGSSNRLIPAPGPLATE